MSRREKRRLSPKQLAARRNNAQQSTGPRTAAGKRRSALNSLKHARYAKAPVRPIVETIVALGGDPKAFTSLLLRASDPTPLSRPPNPNSPRGVKGRKAVAPLYEPVASPDGNLQHHSQEVQKGRSRGNEPEKSRRIGKNNGLFFRPLERGSN